MADDEALAILREIRDLQSKQLEVAQQALSNQSQALANQSKAIQQQEDYRRRIGVTRRWLSVVFWVIGALIVIYLVQPWLFLLFMRHVR
jgi:hypothetical protein